MNPITTRRKNPDGSVSEYLVLNGNHITLKFAPDSERESSAETFQNVRDALFQELTQSGKLAKLASRKYCLGTF